MNQALELNDTVNEIARLLVNGFEDWESLGNIGVRVHEEYEDLFIFNYTAAAAFANEWNDYERACRGLIINGQTGEIVARAFDKFFNWGESDRFTTANIKLVQEKMDGSLGVLYRYDGEYFIATRGAFGSPQAIVGTEILSNYDLSGLPDNLTLLFEIIYPDNRIVVDYGDQKKLTLLAARDRFTGEYIDNEIVNELADRYGFERPIVYEGMSIDRLLELKEEIPASEAEGFVVLFEDGCRYKFKGLEYLKYHRFLQGVSWKNTVIAHRDGDVDGIIETIPDEFLTEFKSYLAQIEDIIADTNRRVDMAFGEAPRDGDRKEYAMWVMQNYKELSTYLFMRLDGRDILPVIYKNMLKD